MTDDLVAQFEGLSREQASAVAEQLDGMLGALGRDEASGVDRGARERLEGFVAGVRVGLAVQ